MSKKATILAVMIAVCLIFAQSVFASDVEFTNEYRQFEVKEAYALSDVFWFNPTIYCIDVLQFIQAYMMPEDALGFFNEARNFTDEQIEDYFPIFQSVFQPELVGYLNFDYCCDYEKITEDMPGLLDLDPEAAYLMATVFEESSIVNELFPRGVGRASSYDTFRRTAQQLALYVAKHEKTPGFDYCVELINDIFEYYNQQYEDAMAAEAAAMEAAAAAEAQAEANATTEAPATEAPATEAPAAEAPSTETPAAETPATN